jgi:hypothetical protein
MSRHRPLTALYRFDVAGRTLLAALGGFLLTSAICILFASVLIKIGVSRASATATSTQLGFLVWVLLAMWMFYAPRWKAMLGKLLLFSALTIAALWLVRT